MRGKKLGVSMPGFWYQTVHERREFGGSQQWPKTMLAVRGFERTDRFAAELLRSRPAVGAGMSEACSHLAY